MTQFSRRGGFAGGVLLTLLLVAGSCAHSRLEDQGSDPLLARQAAFSAAFAARDAESVAAFFAADAALHVAGMPAVEGREAIRAFYANVFRFLTASAVTPAGMQISAGGDMAYTTGRVVNEFRGPQGTTEHPGKYVVVWRKLGGEWYVVHYGVSSDRPDGAQ